MSTEKIGRVERALIAKFMGELLDRKPAPADPTTLIRDLISDEELQRIVDRVMEIPPEERAEMVLAEARRSTQ
jgi:hypothetical protein